MPGTAGNRNRAKADAVGVQEVGVEFVGQVALGQAKLSDAAEYPPKLVKVRRSYPSSNGNSTKNKAAAPTKNKAPSFFSSGAATKNNAAAPSSKATEQASTNPIAKPEYSGAKPSFTEQAESTLDNANESSDEEKENITPKQVDKQSKFVTNTKSVGGAFGMDDSPSDMETEEDRDRKRKSDVLDGQDAEQQPPLVPPAVQQPVLAVQEQQVAAAQQPAVVALPPVVQEQPAVVALPPVVQEQPAVVALPPVVQPVAAAQQGDFIGGHFIPALERLKDVQGKQFNSVGRYYKYQTGRTMKVYDAFPQRVKQEWGRRMRAQFSALNGGLLFG